MKLRYEILISIIQNCPLPVSLKDAIVSLLECMHVSVGTLNIYINSNLIFILTEKCIFLLKQTKKNNENT